jgi:predicted aspartyl protease
MPTVSGKINERLEALAPLRFVGGREVECLLDTGATCALVLPPALVADLGLLTVGYVQGIQLLGGERTDAALALAEIEWLGQTRQVEVIVRDDFIIGTELLDGACVVLDYRARTLTIITDDVVIND